MNVKWVKKLIKNLEIEKYFLLILKMKDDYHIRLLSYKNII